MEKTIKVQVCDVCGARGVYESTDFDAVILRRCPCPCGQDLCPSHCHAVRATHFAGGEAEKLTAEGCAEWVARMYASMGELLES